MQFFSLSFLSPLRFVFLGLPLVLSLTAHAEIKSSYFGLGVQSGRFEVVNTEFEPLNAQFTYGSYLTDNLAIEWQAAFGIEEAELNVEGSDVSMTLSKSISVFGKADIPVGSVFKLYGLLGYSYAEFDFEENFTRFGSDDYGYSFGLGAEVALPAQLALRLEGVRLMNTERYDYDVMTLLLSRTF